MKYLVVVVLLLEEITGAEGYDHKKTEKERKEKNFQLAPDIRAEKKNGVPNGQFYFSNNCHRFSVKEKKGRS